MKLLRRRVARVKLEDVDISEQAETILLVTGTNTKRVVSDRSRGNPPHLTLNLVSWSITMDQVVELLASMHEALNLIRRRGRKRRRRRKKRRRRRKRKRNRRKKK
jgi:hypothetical protein